MSEFSEKMGMEVGNNFKPSVRKLALILTITHCAFAPALAAALVTLVISAVLS